LFVITLLRLMLSIICWVRYFLNQNVHGVQTTHIPTQRVGWNRHIRRVVPVESPRHIGLNWGIVDHPPAGLGRLTSGWVAWFGLAPVWPDADSDWIGGLGVLPIWSLCPSASVSLSAMFSEKKFNQRHWETLNGGWGWSGTQ
jgi:hypothetical protein